VGHGPSQIFGWPPAWRPIFLLTVISRSSLFDWHILYSSTIFSQQNFRRFVRLSGDGSDDIHKPMLGLIGLITAIPSSLQWKITMQERCLCWLPYLFFWPRTRPHFFHFRIATATPVSHPLTRPNHISSSCWTIYRSFEITLEMGTFHWVKLQIQCSIQIHCFKKHSVRYELCFKKYLAA